MAAPPSNAHTIVAISEMLGSMKINPDALEWPNDVPVARTVINAVAGQFIGSSDVANASNKAALRAVIKETVLEDKELQILKEIDGDPSQPAPTLVGYKSPSEFQREIDRIELETAYLEEETERLRLRTQQIIKGSRSVSHDIRSLQNIVNSVNGDPSSRLDEFSMQMDGALADVLEAGHSLLLSLEPLTGQSYVSSFQHINEVFSTYTHSFISQLTAAEASLTTSLTESSFDAEVLDDLLRRYGPDVRLEDMPSSVREFYRQEAYLAQVDTLCDRMDGICVSGSDVISSVLSSAGDYSATPEASMVPNAHVEVEAAVAMDHCAYINAHGSFLDNAVSIMEDSVLAPLDHLLSNLSLEEKLVQDSQVLCGVLSKEMESGIRAVIPSPSSPEAFASYAEYQAPGDVGAQAWEHELEAHLHRYGPGEDILSQSLSALNIENKAILDTIYANSPLNTSPPFAYSCHFTDLMDEARNATTRLAEETHRLTEEVEHDVESRRAQQKLTTFVDRWVTG
ncbi:hypothetical protein D9756_005679 [Leucocoprinus leucothites]|uniref:Uncharacterized protein n=1 Tax=Leucocoprinus leucothites TaxID=201217 RepID=A0A8H5FZZ3_9AGAR|nr:hypothetical protein D9756_005679 [Leucoagaricus leucothites]